VLEEKREGIIVREEDRAFIANFYKYGFVGLVLEWIGWRNEGRSKIDYRKIKFSNSGYFFPCTQ
jgi:hypothetical protein